MIEASILGGLLGGVSRFAPELLKFFDRKGERKHEIALLDKQLEADKVRTASQLQVINAQASAAQFTSALDALKEAFKSQAVVTGIKVIDAISALVRPMVTYTVFGMWVLVKITTLMNYTETMPLAEAVKLWWGDADQAMLVAILNFWFMGRVFEKALR